MAADKEIFGRIDCPCCGTKDGVRVTKDKNGNPFGFCDAVCDVQIRIGGSVERVKKFYAKYPHIKTAMQGEAAPAEKAPAPEAEKPISINEKPAVKIGFDMGL